MSAVYRIVRHNTTRWGIVVVGGIVLAGLAFRRLTPCPAWLSWVLTLPGLRRIGHAEDLATLLDLQPGMKILDAGAGPGRLSLAFARYVGSDGLVVALDCQPAMLTQLRTRADRLGIPNVLPVLGELGADAPLPADTFDRAVLVHVLGEIRSRQAALHELYRALKPGGMLAVVETLPDPHFLPRRGVRAIAEAVGFTLVRQRGTPLGYTMLFQKPYEITITGEGSLTNAHREARR